MRRRVTSTRTVEQPATSYRDMSLCTTTSDDDDSTRPNTVVDVDAACAVQPVPAPVLTVGGTTAVRLARDTHVIVRRALRQCTLGGGGFSAVSGLNRLWRGASQELGAAA